MNPWCCEHGFYWIVYTHMLTKPSTLLATQHLIIHHYICEVVAITTFQLVAVEIQIFLWININQQAFKKKVNEPLSW